MMRVLLSAMSLISFSLLLGMHGLQQPAGVELDPDRPRQYFEVGELAAAKASREDELDKARQVLAMGVVLAERQNDRQTASSCCIAIANTHGDDPWISQQLWDLALQLDPSRLVQWAEHRRMGGGQKLRRDAAECIRLARTAGYADAKALLDRRAVEDQIRQTAQRLGYNPGEIVSSLRRQVSHTGRDPCNGNYFDAQVENGQSVRRVCREHAYPIGTAESLTMLRQYLAIENACVNDGSELADWGGASAMGQQEALRDPSIRWLVSTYGIDPARPALRNGRWVSSP